MSESRISGLGLKNRAGRVTLLGVFVTGHQIRGSKWMKPFTDNWQEPHSHTSWFLWVVPATPISAGSAEHTQCTRLLQSTDVSFLTQVVERPVRKDVLLDLVLTNNKELAGMWMWGAALAAVTMTRCSTGSCKETGSWVRSWRDNWYLQASPWNNLVGTCPRGKRGPWEVANTQGTAWQLFIHSSLYPLKPLNFYYINVSAIITLMLKLQVLWSRGSANTCLASDSTAITNITCISRITNITSLIAWEQTDKNQMHMFCLFTQGIAGSPWFTVNKFRGSNHQSKAQIVSRNAD